MMENYDEKTGYEKFKEDNPTCASILESEYYGKGEKRPHQDWWEMRAIVFEEMKGKPLHETVKELNSRCASLGIDKYKGDLSKRKPRRDV